MKFEQEGMPTMFRVRPDSPLLHLPAELSERQIILLDGIRYSADMAGIAMDRLWEVIQRIDRDFDAATWHDTSEAMLFAWSVVDSAHRFGQLVEGLPGLSQRGWPNELSKRLSVAEEFRHAWQHQRSESHSAVERRDQAFGAIGWFRHLNDKPVGPWHFAIAGSDLKGSKWFAGPHVAIDRVGTRRIRLLYGERPLYLSRLVRDIFWGLARLEQEFVEGRIRLVGEAVDRARGQDMFLQLSVGAILEPDPAQK